MTRCPVSTPQARDAGIMGVSALMLVWLVPRHNGVLDGPLICLPVHKKSARPQARDRHDFPSLESIARNKDWGHSLSREGVSGDY